MNLGIVVVDERCAPHALGLLKAARNRKWGTRCFLSDRGVHLLSHPEFLSLVNEGGTHVSVCELSIERYADAGVSVEGLEDRVIVGGQYQDAELAHNSDCVLVF